MKCTVCGEDTLSNYGNTKDVICSSCVKLKLNARPNLATDYNTAIAVASFISFLGLVSVVAGAAMSVWLLKQGQMALLGVPASITISLIGLLLVVGGQTARATMDTANHSKEIADTMKNIFEIIRSTALLQSHHASKNAK